MRKIPGSVSLSVFKLKVNRVWSWPSPILYPVLWKSLQQFLCNPADQLTKQQTDMARKIKSLQEVIITSTYQELLGLWLHQTRWKGIHLWSYILCLIWCPPKDSTLQMIRSPVVDQSGSNFMCCQELLNCCWMWLLQRMAATSQWDPRPVCVWKTGSNGSTGQLR